ncbi:thyroid peroxidase isoform X1 [Poecilia latipinna]|uniref:thyroid peroxidase isoform X1 n=1 Tax=Poecilia latipinna TaxID=48699 RepID=UPI00072ED0A8|nr:PREDICTED: thyroid peroxidase isoform X1 [Poecilia latipinna]
MSPQKRAETRLLPGRRGAMKTKKCLHLSLLVMLVCVVPPTPSTLSSSSLRDFLVSSPQDADGASSQRRRAAPLCSHGFRFHFQPQTQEISRSGEIFHAALQILKNAAKQKYNRNFTASELLSQENLELLAELSQCPTETDPAVCEGSHHDKYRSISGVCNNRQNPDWGAANTALVRWLPAEYEDGEEEPRGWDPQRLHHGSQLPPPRRVSREVVRTSCKDADAAYSQLLADWGQYIDHDVTLTPQSLSGAASWTQRDCRTSCENLHPCFPIQTQDSLCMPFQRSTPACCSRSGSGMQRQQLNAVSSFIDASLVYGHTPPLQSDLRDLSGRSGKLAVNGRFQDRQGRPYLPFVAETPSACGAAGRGRGIECFRAGEGRVNEGLPLIVLHTLWLREHNRLADTLKLINQHWSPEAVFQEARKIVGALHQIITMRDYIPKVIGAESFERHIGPYGGYDPTVDSSASNVFATAAFRFGHATIPPILSRLNESFQEDRRFPRLRLQQALFSPWRIVKEGGIEPTLRGMVATAAAVAAPDSLLVEEVTESLLVLDSQQNLDLAALNLQRGRDHGLPGYNDWRDFCGLKRIATLDDLAEVVRDRRVAEKILHLYQHPDNIDVWLGGLVENFLAGSRTGPLFACLIGKQMKLLRDGDRFWWEADGVFTQQQREQLWKTSLSRIICENSDIQEIPADPFRLARYPDGFLPCSAVPALSLEAWRDEPSLGLRLCGSPRPVDNGDFLFSSRSGKLTALYACFHGFQLEGAAEAVCEGGVWSADPPCCSETRLVARDAADPQTFLDSNQTNKT